MTLQEIYLMVLVALAGMVIVGVRCYLCGRIDATEDQNKRYARSQQEANERWEGMCVDREMSGFGCQRGPDVHTDERLSPSEETKNIPPPIL